MARPKKKVPVKAPTGKAPKDPRVEKIYEEEITFTCPIRGLVKQKVKIKRFKPLGEQPPTHVLTSNEFADKLEEADDGLSIYSDGEDLGITGEEAE